MYSIFSERATILSPSLGVFTVIRIGIDLGGTKISGIALSADGEECGRLRIDTPRGDYQATLDAVRAMADTLAGDTPAAPIGIGIPGAMSPASGLVKNANSTWLIGKPLPQDLARLTGRRVRVANDADCFALSEASDGAGAGAASVFGVILGTGVGGGLVLRGQLLSGPNAIAGEWGHNPLPWHRPDEDPMLPCYCGKAGCIETFLSGPGLAAHHADTFKDSIDTRRIAQADTSESARSMALYHDRLARALAHVINIVDPHVIVLGGGMSEIDSLYSAVPALWGRYVFSDTVATNLRRNKHGADSGVRGAAWLWSPEEAAQ